MQQIQIKVLYKLAQDTDESSSDSWKKETENFPWLYPTMGIPKLYEKYQNDSSAWKKR